MSVRQSNFFQLELLYALIRFYLDWEWRAVTIFNARNDSLRNFLPPKHASSVHWYGLNNPLIVNSRKWR